jgi:D-arabinose 5-phosphate isomerase GutQ
VINVVTKKGGGSTELNEFIRLAKNRGAPLPVATASAESRLARAADVAWFFRKRRTRIRAALSRWGRAWPPPSGAMRSIVLMQISGYSWNEVIDAHPSGAVGKREQLPAALSRLPDPAAPGSHR